MTIIAYKFQSPNGSYWYIKADDQRTIDYWKTKRKLIPLSDDAAVIDANGAVYECSCDGASYIRPECDGVGCAAERASTASGNAP